MTSSQNIWDHFSSRSTWSSCKMALVCPCSIGNSELRICGEWMPEVGFEPWWESADVHSFSPVNLLSSVSPRSDFLEKQLHLPSNKWTVSNPPGEKNLYNTPWGLGPEWILYEDCLLKWNLHCSKSRKQLAFQRTRVLGLKALKETPNRLESYCQTQSILHVDPIGPIQRNGPMYFWELLIKFGN